MFTLALPPCLSLYISACTSVMASELSALLPVHFSFNSSRDLPAKLPEKLCASAQRAKAALNAKDGPPNVDLI